MRTRSNLAHQLLSLTLCGLLAGCGGVGPATVTSPAPAIQAAGAPGLDAVFARADQDRDGRLSSAETGLSVEAFKLLDQNGDGYVTRAEWNRQVSWTTLLRMLPTFKPLVEWVFHQLDANHDGRVDRAELHAGLPDAARTALGSGDLDHSMQLADLDADHALSRDEFDQFYVHAEDAGRGLGGSVAHAMLGLYLNVVSRIATKIAVHPKRLAVTETPAKFGMAFENVSFKTSDNLTLKGWYIPASVQTDKAMILIHGHGNCRMAFVHDQAAVLKALHPDYNVLAFDLRNHGESEGSATTFGYYEGQDALAAIAYLKGRGIRELAVYGVSLGGATAIRGAALSSDLRAVVDDCAYATVQLAFTGFISHDGLPFAPLAAAATLERANRELGIDMTTTEPVTQVARIAPRPFLVIHGAADTNVSPENSRINFQAAGEGFDKQLWIVPGAAHAQSAVVDPTDYAARLTAFTRKVF